MMEKVNFPTFQQALTMMMMNIFSKMTHLIEHNRRKRSKGPNANAGGTGELCNRVIDGYFYRSKMS